MKTRLTFFILILTAVSLDLSGQEADTFVKSDRKQPPGIMDYVSNEVLVKFRDDVVVTPENLEKKSSVSNGLKSALTDIHLDKAEKLFPAFSQRKSGKTILTPQGIEMDVPSLHNIYKLRLKSVPGKKTLSSDVQEAVEMLKKLPEVEYAEPNYIYSIGEHAPVSPEMTEKEAQEWMSIQKTLESNGFVPNDPLFSEQWGIPAIQADQVWDTHTGDSASVIAILDTGVDWLHPDLAENIWINYLEINGNGQDDDGNGFIDDIRGWDFVNNDNDPKDDNSHGTHCAGIVAAVGNNGIGIAGVNWKAKIMPVKVFQSSGRGDAATIAQGIIYASKNGANVLSMSFGSYAMSFTMRQALVNAYVDAVLVAAAGNDKLCIGPGRCPDGRQGQPVFPAAFTFVLGVEAPPRPPFGFTNYDLDGSIFSGYPEQYNYEISAPGTNILSCVPGGNYRSYQGTSMAAPFVAGAVSLYRELKPENTQELMWGDLIHSSSDYLDIHQALNIIQYPVINIISYSLSDTLPGADSDGKADAGETIQLEVFVRNTWLGADSVYVGVEFDEFEDVSVAEILQNQSLIGSVGAYGTLSNFSGPLEIKINPDLVHGREIRFVLSTWAGEDKNFLASVPIVIRTENAYELKGIINDTLTLTPDKFWLVSSSFKIGTDGVLVIKPGTHLKIEQQFYNNGNIISWGTRDSAVNIFGPYGIAYGYGTFRYTNFREFSFPLFYQSEGIFEYCHFSDSNSEIPFDFYFRTAQFNNCTFSGIQFQLSWAFLGDIVLNKSDFSYIKVAHNNFGYLISQGVYGNSSITDCNFSNISSIFINTNSYKGSYLVNSNILSPGLSIKSDPNNYFQEIQSYMGSNDSLLISQRIYDFWSDPNLAIMRYNMFLDRPSSTAHGCVWRVLVNGFDAQDEFKYMDPLGVGMHTFEVYFNRPMDIQYTPEVSMGVREPFNQVSINEGGTWSADSMIYTVSKTLGLSQSDGIHRIMVKGAKDTEGFDLVIENERFNVNIQSQGSLSAGFMATPGMGKVNLEWGSPEEHVGDLLGYNMYRYTLVNDSVTSDTVLISSPMITDTLYTDYDVVPGNTYFYTYKTVRTDFTESSFSKIVAATPYTASKGDANGDLSVNVSDIISTVSFILLKNPQPFIFEAADVNSDGVINVLDVTGIVNRILYPGITTLSSSGNGTATLFFRNDTVFLNTDVPVAGMQFTLHNITSDGYKVLSALEPFERATVFNADSLLFLAYSMTGSTIGPGVVPILKLHSAFTWLDNLVLSNTNGNSITSIIAPVSGPSFSRERMNSLFELSQNYPNPFSHETTIEFSLVRAADEAIFTVMNIMGQKIDEIVIKSPMEGRNQFTWSSPGSNGLYLGRLSIRISGKSSDCKTVKMNVY